MFDIILSLYFRMTQYLLVLVPYLKVDVLHCHYYFLCSKSNQQYYNFIVDVFYNNVWYNKRHCIDSILVIQTT